MQAKNEAKHTPGEWKAEYIGVSDSGPDGVEIYEVIAGGRVRVCEAVFKGDAVLIAAAPELLAELHECQAALSALLGGDPDLISRICGSTTLGNRLVHVRAAIASATAS